MVSKQATVQVGIGFSPVPFGWAKASAKDGIDTKSLCECGSRCGYVTNEDGHFVACKDDECDRTYPNWFAVPQKGFKVGDEYIPVDTDELSEPSVETGQVEKVCDVGNVLLQYAVTGNYYLLPEDEYEGQYGALVGVLNDENLALLTYLQPNSKVRRYAIISRAGVLMALQLADKKAIPSLDYERDEALEGQAKSLLAGQVTDDPTLEDVEDQPIKAAIREQVEPQAFAPEDERDGEADAPTPEV